MPRLLTATCQYGMLGKLQTCKGMFDAASLFSKDLSLWHVENVGMMITGATSFNSDVSLWNVGKVANMDWLFAAFR